MRPLEIGREPALSPVATSVNRPQEMRVSDLKGEPSGDLGQWQQRRASANGSLWQDRRADLFRDPRARHVGDILTVTIQIKDKASLDNNSKRSRDASNALGIDLSHAIDMAGIASKGTGTANSSIKGNTSQDGKGAIARSESIDLRIAATVANVLPSGNLLIEGSQEVRVNYELRVLTFTGIVNTADIKADNTISYERIAEARMSYGGRGRIMEVQQPGWGQQILDQVSPF
jgi:flagellar L-ring protein precursor FlgH